MLSGKMSEWGGGGKGKIRLPAGLVRLQNPYTRWTGPLIGAVSCNLIDVCHLRSFFSSGRSAILLIWKENGKNTLSFDDALAEALSYLSELGMSRVLRPEQKEAIYCLVHGSDLLAVLPTGFGKSLIFQLLIRVKQILSSKAACDCCLSAQKHRARSVNGSIFLMAPS